MEQLALDLRWVQSDDAAELIRPGRRARVWWLAAEDERWGQWAPPWRGVQVIRSPLLC